MTIQGQQSHARPDLHSKGLYTVLFKIGWDFEACIFTLEWRVEWFALQSKVCLPSRPTVENIVLQSETSSCKFSSGSVLPLAKH